MKGSHIDGSILTAVKAVQFGDFQTVKSLIDSHQVSANAVDNDGCSLLHWAAINNRVEIAVLLIRSGAIVPCAGGVLAESPLHWAVRRNYCRVVNLLLSEGADVAYRSNMGLDALCLACHLGKCICHTVSNFFVTIVGQV
jgi:ankyrin repeat protein